VSVDGRPVEVFMRLRLLGICAVLVCFALVGGSAWADGVTVQNGNFGSFNSLSSCGAGCAINSGPIPDWETTAGTDEAGSWQVGPGNIYFNVPLPGGGNTLAFVLDGTLEQDLGALAPDTTYSLTVEVGDRADQFLTGDYSISLDSGSTVMCTSSGTDASIAPGTFAQETCSFTTGSSVPAGDLMVLLSGIGGEAQFTDVAVNAPEPSSIVLLAAGLMLVAVLGVYYKRKAARDVA